MQKQQSGPKWVFSCVFCVLCFYSCVFIVGAHLCESNNLVLGGVAGDEVVEVGDDVHADRAGQVVPVFNKHNDDDDNYNQMMALKMTTATRTKMTIVNLLLGTKARVEAKSAEEQMRKKIVFIF